MMSRTYIAGLDVLGSETNRAILIKVKNADELARGQGKIASFAQAVAPATVEAKVYDEMAAQLRQSLAEKHVAADVSIVDPAGWKATNSAHIWQDVGIGLGAFGLAAILWHFIGGR